MKITVFRLKNCLRLQRLTLVSSSYVSFDSTQSFGIKNCSWSQQNRYINTNSLSIKSDGTIDPYYISGLTQADGSFSCGIQNIESRRLRFSPKFEIVVDLDSKNVLDLIQKYLKCGSIQIKSSDHTARFIVTNLDELRDIIIPHFKLYPVYFNKLHAFNSMTSILDLLKKKHKDRDNVAIFSLAISMNEASRRTNEQIKELFSVIADTAAKPHLVKIPNNIKKVTHELKPGFISGLIDGDGSYNVAFLQDGKILPQLTIALGLSCHPLLEEIKKYLGLSITVFERESIYELRIRNLETLVNFVIPFTDANPLHTEKKIHYEIWKEVCFLLYNNKNECLTEATFLKIVDLAYNMNKGGKRRKVTKEEYIRSCIPKKVGATTAKKDSSKS